jgi:formylglycine-generating enzyme required for sulfatase activity
MLHPERVCNPRFSLLLLPSSASKWLQATIVNMTHSLIRVIAAAILCGCASTSERDHQAMDLRRSMVHALFVGSKAGEERRVGGIVLCWCPPGRFFMGSPSSEAERRSDERQVLVTLTKGFWAGKFEVTQGEWKRVVGEFPGKQPANEGDNFPVVEINFEEAEEFCRKLTEIGRASGELPKEWEFRIPTEAQWEYACRAGTTTATSFGDKLSSKQANFLGLNHTMAGKRGRR